MPAHVKPRGIAYQLNNLVRAFKGRDDASVSPDFSEVEALQIFFFILFLQFLSNQPKGLITHPSQGLYGYLTWAGHRPFTLETCTPPWTAIVGILKKAAEQLGVDLKQPTRLRFILL